MDFFIVAMNLHISPPAFSDFLYTNNIRRGYFVWHNQQCIASDDQLGSFAKALEQLPDYHHHEAVFFEQDQKTNCIYWAFVHNTHRGAAQGGVRFLPYTSLENVLVDGLRLSEGMTYKNALARLWWGGGKGVICNNGSPERSSAQREQIFARYGRFVASLNGCYIAAEDMNTNTEDMRILHANCRHCTCLPQDIGGSGNPSPFTAHGVFEAMRAAIHFSEGKASNFTGKHVAVQGAGNVGYPLIELLVAAGARVTTNDPNAAAREKVRHDFSGAVEVLEPQSDNDTEYGNRILQTDCDILAPCAIGAIINEHTIPLLQTQIIAGAANNQLKNPISDAQSLHQRGILYLPDYVINRMGIVNCANEMYGYVPQDVKNSIDHIYPDVFHILEESHQRGINPFEYADVWAHEEALVDHPIWGHRGVQIIEKLQYDQWEKM